MAPGIVPVAHACSTMLTPANDDPTMDGARRNPRGRYQNRYPHTRHGRRDYLRMLTELLPARRRGTPPETQPVETASNGTDRLVWLGHSSYLIEIDGKRLITDPHLTQRASPLPFGEPKRFQPPAMSLDTLPKIDGVLLSHNHYDHLDAATVQALAQRDAPWFAVPLGVGDWFARRGIGRVTELDWWQQHDFDGVPVHCVPAQHFSGRSASDTNRTLWCGLIAELGGRKIYFAGDTGYSDDFKDIGRRLGPIDVALIPIGAYEPRWFMAPMHVNPEEAVQIHLDVRAKVSLAMHWGTFRLTTEPVDEPPRRLAAARAAAGLEERSFQVLLPGESRTLAELLGADPQD